ncbi:hypothetical protein TcWFU_003363 [Taenia crassiceps]|uniref:C2H2-type domain-containing protein n=1 Tax=Taenia crassiceps TaxID=6207 RepID=A0ABR4Q0R8_9CEST
MSLFSPSPPLLPRERQTVTCDAMKSLRTRVRAVITSYAATFKVRPGEEVMMLSIDQSTCGQEAGTSLVKRLVNALQRVFNWQLASLSPHWSHCKVVSLITDSIMANTDDSRRNGNGRSAPPHGDPMKQQQRHQQQQEGTEADQPETTNTLALCPQCPFASRSPSEVDEHMINVHRATLPSEGSQEAEPVEKIPTSSFPTSDLSPQLSTLLSLARAFPEAGSIAFPGMSVLRASSAINPGNPDQIIPMEGAQRPILEPLPEDTPGSSSSLMQNIPIQTDSRRRYKCSKCPNSFPWHGDLTDHMKRVHGITKSSRNCSRGGSAANGNATNECARSSRSAGTYQCPFCKYDAKYLSELRRHKRLHMGVKPFACIFCAYKSAWKGDLKRHMESHHKDKFETDDDLARIMAQFKNNAGTTALDPSEEQIVRPSSATSANSPNSQANRDVSMLLGLPSTSHADLSIPTTAAASQLLINTLLTLPPTTQSLDPRFYTSIHSLASLLTPPTNPSQSSSLEVPSSPLHPSLQPPSTQELLLPPPSPLPLSSKLSATTPPPAIESLSSLLSSWNWMVIALAEAIKVTKRRYTKQFLPNMPPEGISSMTTLSQQPLEGQQHQPAQSCGNADEPLNLVCKTELSASPLNVNQASSSQVNLPPTKRRLTKPSRSSRGSGSREELYKPYRCSSCGHRSNWKWDINKHIRVAHPERPDVTTITMDQEEAKQTLPAYLERVRAFGRNGRSSAPCCDEMNPTCSNGSGSCQQDREGYIRPYMCSFCGHRSNWKWDLRKHMKIMHGREGKVITLSNEEARRTLDQYKANRRQGQGRLLRWSTTDVLSEPSTSRQCYASEASRDTTGSPDYNNSRPASNGSSQPSEGNIKAASAFRCCVCKMIFPMWKSLAQHIAFHHPGLGEATTLAATATGNIVMNAATSRSISSSPLEPTSSRVSSKRSLTSASPNKLSSGEDEQSVMEVKACGLQHLAFTEAPSIDPVISSSISSTPTSLAESESVKQRPKLRAKRSLIHQVASSSTQTQSPLLLSTLDNLLSGSATDSIAAVFQFAEILKQAVTFLQSLLGEGSQEAIENLNEQLPPGVPDQLLPHLEGDENEPSTLADRSQRLALLLVDPQVQSLTDQLLPLLQRVKQRYNISDSIESFRNISVLSFKPARFRSVCKGAGETFICGWGPGGQAINKTANCVRLKHLPTGICVKCQDGRDLQANRMIARKRLEERLDEYFNGESSVAAVRRKEAQARENNRFSRAKRRLEMKAAFKAKCLKDDQSSD